MLLRQARSKQADDAAADRRKGVVLDALKSTLNRRQIALNATNCP
jgi:hypothetical protein